MNLVQIVCYGYLHAAKVDASKQRVKTFGERPSGFVYLQYVYVSPSDVDSMSFNLPMSSSQVQTSLAFALINSALVLGSF